MNRKMIVAAIAVLGLAFTCSATLLAWRAGVLRFADHDAESGRARENDDASPPRNGMALVRTLFRYQDQIAQGDRDAVRAQYEIIDKIADEFRSFRRKDWAEPQNVQAMMAYVLSGGKTEVAEEFLATEQVSKEQELLAKGVLSFALRRPKTAIKQIGDLETRNLDRPLVSVVSLALASLHAEENGARSIALFDDARLHAPRTAIEESAIRREVPILLRAHDIKRAEALIARYIRIFGRSPFAPRFYSELAASFTNVEEAKAVTAIKAIDASLDDQKPVTKSDFFLRVSRAALIAGKIVLAKAAADIVAMSDPDETEITDKARLYAAAAGAATENAADALPELLAVQDVNFDEEEKSIRAAAETIARSVIEAGTVKTVSAISRDLNTDAETLIAPDDVQAVVQKVATALKAADDLISSVKE